MKRIILGLFLVLTGCASDTRVKFRKGPIYLMDCKELGPGIYDCKSLPEGAQVCPIK